MVHTFHTHSKESGQMLQAVLLTWPAKSHTSHPLCSLHVKGKNFKPHMPLAKARNELHLIFTKPVSWKQSTIQKATHVDLILKTGKKMRLNWTVKYHRTVEINGISQKEKSSWMTIKRYLIFLYNSTAGTPLNKQWKGSNQVNQAGMKN